MGLDHSDFSMIILSCQKNSHRSFRNMQQAGPVSFSSRRGSKQTDTSVVRRSWLDKDFISQKISNAYKLCMH
jgi:hypothetical protein